MLVTVVILAEYTSNMIPCSTRNGVRDVCHPRRFGCCSINTRVVVLPGWLVDDAIVVVENVERVMEDNSAKRSDRQCHRPGRTGGYRDGAVGNAD